MLVQGKHDPPTIWKLLLQRMDQSASNDKLRIVLFVIYRHLVYAFGNDPPTTPFDYKSLLVSSLRSSLNTATPKVYFLRFETLSVRKKFFSFFFRGYKIFSSIDRRYGLSWISETRRKSISHRIHRSTLRISLSSG